MISWPHRTRRTLAGAYAHSPEPIARRHAILELQKLAQVATAPATIRASRDAFRPQSKSPRTLPCHRHVLTSGKIQQPVGPRTRWMIELESGQVVLFAVIASAPEHRDSFHVGLEQVWTDGLSAPQDFHYPFARRAQRSPLRAFDAIGVLISPQEPHHRLV